jgi:4,5-DOPA dioxygenase extradiol
MDRKQFLRLLAFGSLSSGIMDIKDLYSQAKGFEKSPLMPLLFVGHGSPMNAIEENEFVKGWRNTALNLPQPKAILCISAHWETRGTFVTAMSQPRTIHDFGGFPDELFKVQYPAPGSKSIAQEIQQSMTQVPIGMDNEWGLDHGCWSVLKQMYPKADIPVLQLSLDYSISKAKHLELGQQLSFLRERGVLVIGSGNMVHNLRKLNWQNPESGYDWAIEANEGFKKMIESNELSALTNIENQGNAYQLSIPTPEHYLPLLYILGLKSKDEPVSFFNDSTVMGSISMTSVKVG